MSTVRYHDFRAEKTARSISRELSKYLDTHSFYSVSLTPRTAFLKQFKKSDRLEVVRQLTESFIKKLQSYALKKPLLAENKHLLIDAICVVEALSKSQQDVSEHSHSVFMIHKDIEKKIIHSALKNEISFLAIEKIKAKASFVFNEKKYSFNEIFRDDYNQTYQSIHSELIPVHTAKLFQDTFEDVIKVLAYNFKNSDCERKFYNPFLAFNITNSEKQNNEVSRRDRNFIAHKKNRISQAFKQHQPIARAI